MIRGLMLIAALGTAAIALCSLVEDRRKRDLLAHQVARELEALRRETLLRLYA